MGLSVAGVPGGTLTPFQENLRRLALEVVEAHRHCRDASDLLKCDLYYHVIEAMQDLAFGVIAEERALMICGHPAACAQGGACSACAREARLLAEAGRMKCG